MPGITHDGVDYTVNFGESGKMRYLPPDASYLTVSEATRNKLVAEEVRVFLENVSDPVSSGDDKLLPSLAFKGRDKLLFVEGKKYWKMQEKKKDKQVDDQSENLFGDAQESRERR